MRRLRRQALTAARGGDRPILITGGVGTGKTHLARFIHAQSPRSNGPLVFVDCGGLPDLDNTLFGHRRGAFTSAETDLSGRLQEANGGCLVLDDFERLSHHHQDQFHRLVVDGTFYPVGSEKPRQVDVRFIATSNKDIREEIERGSLKWDFVSRLDYFVIEAPPLHHHPEDIPALARELLERNVADLVAKGIRVPGAVSFSEDCWPALKARTFPDNVRGLDKLVVRLLAHLGDRSVIRPADIEAALPSMRTTEGHWFDEPRSLRRVREAVERRYILDVCRHTGFNMRQTARILEISPKSLYAKLKAYGISRP